MPFIYPKGKHYRKHVPPTFSHYRSFKPFLQSEFANKCVYCMTPDTIKGYDVFGVDHYLPKKKFPELIVEYSNLYYCCNKCNRLKGNFYPLREKKIFIPNPCDHIMFEHLQFKNEKVISKTNAGDFTIELLLLNDDELIQLRKLLITAKQALNNELAELNYFLKKINSTINTLSVSKQKKYLNEKNKILSEIDRIKENINTIQGFRTSNQTLH